MIFYNRAYFDEIKLLYFVNSMQFVALVIYVYSVFTELMVICDIDFFTIRPKGLNNPKKVKKVVDPKKKYY